AEPAEDAARGVRDGHEAGEEPAVLPVVAAEADLHLDEGAGLAGLRPHGSHARLVVRVDDAGRGVGVARPFRHPGVLVPPGVEVLRVPGADGGEDVDDLRQGLGDVPEPALALAEGLLGLLLLGDVLHGPDHAHDAAVLAELGAGVVPHPAHGAVFGDEAVLAHAGLPRPQLLVAAQPDVEVVRVDQLAPGLAHADLLGG